MPKCRQTDDAETENRDTGESVDEQQLPGIKPATEKSYGAGQGDPPKQRTAEDATDHECCRTIAARLIANAEAGKEGSERQDGERIGQGQKKSGAKIAKPSGGNVVDRQFGGAGSKKARTQIK